MYPDLSHDEILRYSRHLLIPEVGLEGQKKLLAYPVHLIAHNTDDFVERALSEWEVVVDAGAELANVAGTEKELVAGHFGIRRGLAQGRNKEL